MLYLKILHFVVTFSDTCWCKTLYYSDSWNVYKTIQYCTLNAALSDWFFYLSRALLYTFDFIIQLSDVPFSVKFIIAYLCY